MVTDFGQGPQASTENSQMCGQEASVEFLVYMKTLVPGKTRECGRVPEATLFNYWETKFHICTAGPASNSPRHEERGDTQVLGEWDT